MEPKELQPLAEGPRIVPLKNALTKFEKTGTADVVVGKDFGISIKDEGDYVSVRFGSNHLTPVGSVPTGKRNFATKEEACTFAKHIQDLLHSKNLPSAGELLAGRFCG